MTQSRHTATPAKTLIAQQLNGTRALLATLHTTQLSLKSELQDLDDQDLSAATQALLHTNRNHINFLTSEVERLHLLLKTWDDRKQNYQEKGQKKEKAPTSLEDKVTSLNNAINQKREQLVNLSEKQRVLKIDKRVLKEQEHSVVQLEVNSNKQVLNYLSTTIVRLKALYDNAHEAWFQSTKA